MDEKYRARIRGAFSERHKLNNFNTIIQSDEFNLDTRIRLFNAVYNLFDAYKKTVISR